MVLSPYGHLTAILTALARVQMHEVDASLSEWLPRQIADLEWGTTVIVVTPHLSLDDVWVLHNAYRRGSKVIAMVCATQADLESVRAQAGKLNVLVHQTIWEKDLHNLSKTGEDSTLEEVFLKLTQEAAKPQLLEPPQQKRRRGLFTFRRGK